MTEREACIVLNLIPGIGIARYRALVAAAGSAAAALELSHAELVRLHGFGEQLAQSVAEWRTSVDLAEELEACEAAGVRIITYACDDFPESLRCLDDPPLCLYVRGELPDFTGRTVSIVGSRRMSAYGRRMTETLTQDAVAAGWVVVSGLAFGIDSVAHRTALDAGGITVGVLGSGLGRIHPQEHVPLARAMVDSGGALVSEYPLNFPVNRRSLPRRNRIISALADAVIVVEAGVDSGALITARAANDQGKSIFAVPGQADNPQAMGCNRLIKLGEAALIETFNDVLVEMGFVSGHSNPEPGSAQGRVVVDLFASPEEQNVCRLLAAEGQQRFDLLAGKTGMAAGSLTAVLMKMEMEARVLQLPGKVYALR